MGVQLPVLHLFVERLHCGYQPFLFTLSSQALPLPPLLFKFTNVFFLNFRKDWHYFKICLKLKAAALAKQLLPNSSYKFQLH